MELRLPLDKLEKLKTKLFTFLRKHKASRAELESLGGILADCCKVIHRGRTFSRRVYDLSSLVKKRNFKVRLNEDFRLDLKWWLEFVYKFNGEASIIPASVPAVSVLSDVSVYGVGAAMVPTGWPGVLILIKRKRSRLGWVTTLCMPMTSVVVRTT
jgi:hypothetical protein